MRQLPVQLPPERPRDDGGGGFLRLTLLLTLVFAVALWAIDALL